MPSILTGVGPHESLTKLHAFPLLWQWARAAKMASVYVSAETYEWAQFSSFFFTEAPDFWMTADLMAARFGVASGKRNDGGVDDLLATQVFIERMSQVPPAQRLMGIFNPNALHMPCQAESPLMPANGPRRRTRCENGLAILDQSLSMIYGFLEKSGRLDRTLVILTADHGDTEKPQHIFPRISSFYSEIMNIPFWIRIPKAWKQDQAEAFRHLRQATEKNVMNLDILPTVVDFLKLDRHPQNQKLTTQWEGRSLLRTLDSHRPLIALNSTEYKNCPQPGLGVYWDHYRFVYTQAMGPELYDIDQDPFELRNVWKKGPHSSHSFEIESLVQKTPALRRIWQIQP